MLNSLTDFSFQNVANKTSPPKWQFNGNLSDGSQAGFMLNTDFELFYDLTLDSTTARATCSFSNSVCGIPPTTGSCPPLCQTASTYSQAQSYSQVKTISLYFAIYVDQ